MAVVARLAHVLPIPVPGRVVAEVDMAVAEEAVATGPVAEAVAVATGREVLVERGPDPAEVAHPVAAASGTYRAAKSALSAWTR